MIKFSQLKKGSKFKLNGNTLIKKSSKTALIIDFNKWFYIGKNEIVNPQL